ncbi:hypothetical protein HanRHA438_Chr13g0628571 [Helianthus annuus]|nr:hypothetical protein HanRHA438_Chr13g0628571 [Helianthus annuus]
MIYRVLSNKLCDFQFYHFIHPKEDNYSRMEKAWFLAIGQLTNINKFYLFLSGVDYLQMVSDSIFVS